MIVIRFTDAAGACVVGSMAEGVVQIRVTVEGRAIGAFSSSEPLIPIGIPSDYPPRTVAWFQAQRFWVTLARGG